MPLSHARQTLQLEHMNDNWTYMQTQNVSKNVKLFGIEMSK